MGRLILLVLAFCLALYAQSLMTEAAIFSPHVLRDGLFLSLIAAFTFGWNSHPAPDVPTDQADARYSGDSVAHIIKQPNGFTYQNPAEPVIRRSSAVIWLLFILLTGAALRLWAAESLPGQCIGSECITLMALSEPENLGAEAADLSDSPILSNMLEWALPNFDDPTSAMRLVGTVIGWLTLLFLFLFVRSVGSFPAALISIALLMQHPWHIWASITADRYITIPFLCAIVGWLVVTGVRSGHVFRLAAAGFFFALFWFESGILQLTPVLWLLMLVPISIIALWNRGTKQVVGGLGLLLGVLAISVITGSVAGLLPDPVSLPAEITAASGDADGRPSITFSAGREIATNLFYRGNYGHIGVLIESSIPGVLVGSLFILGIGVLLRRLVRYESVILATGMIAAGTGLFLAMVIGVRDPLLFPPSSLLLVLLPFFFLCSALAIDQLLQSIQQIWRPLIRPEYFVYGFLGLALIVPATGTGDLISNFESVSSGAGGPLDALLVEYLAEALPATEGEPITYYLPTDFAANPTTALQIGPDYDRALADERIRPFDPMADLYFISPPSGRLVYLLDGNNRNLIELLRQLFPMGSIETFRNADDEDSAQLIAFHVTVEDAQISQGLTVSFYAGNDPPATAREAVHVKQGEIPDGVWTNLPVDGSFSSRWRGTIILPASGPYGFQVSASPDAAVRLMLDNQTVLDTEQDIGQTTADLARGPYRFTLQYRSETLTEDSAPMPMTLLWQPPGRGFEAIPASLYRSTLPPSVGLIGKYYAGSDFAPPELFAQKDLLVGINADLEYPYSVIWKGKLAANRSGEYLFGLLTAGRTALRVDGHLVVDGMHGAGSKEDEQSTGFSSEPAEADNRIYLEGLIYLNRGWHDVEIAYIPAEDGVAPGQIGLDIFWSPPGSTPGSLPNRYLLPLSGELSLLDYPLPQSPQLVDARLGNEMFALSQAQHISNPQSTILAQNLPLFDAEMLWQTEANCGSGPEQFQDVHGIQIDPGRERLYVADTGNRRIVSLDLEGSIAAIYESDLFEEPFDLALQFEPESDNLVPLVLDAVSQRIFRIDPDSDDVAPMTLGTSYYRPRGMSTDRDGNIFIADTGGARISSLRPNGEPAGDIGGRETLLGLGQPVDAVVAGGQLWALTAEDGRLWKLSDRADESGSITAVLATNTLNGPHMAGLTNGGLFVVDPVRRIVTYHAPNGQPLLYWTHPSLQEPVDIDLQIVSEELLMAISDHGTCSISLWRLDRMTFGT